MPTHQRLWPNDLKSLQYRRKPAIQLDEEHAIGIGQPNPAPAPPLQHDQLLSEHRDFSLEPRLRSERRGQNGQNEAEEPDHPTTLSDSLSSSME
jgi:hypothetical protein